MTDQAKTTRNVVVAVAAALMLAASALAQDSEAVPYTFPGGSHGAVGVRDLPDVSLFAADGVWNHAYVFCNSDPATFGAPCVGAPSNWSLGGGTSFGTPIMAGMQALVNQVWGGRQGNPAPIYYTLARQEYGTRGKQACESSIPGGPAWYCTFYDITAGDNDVDCSGPYNCYDPAGDQGVPGVLSLFDNSYQPAFTPSVGWDFTSGIGTVNATNLVLNPI